MGKFQLRRGLGLLLSAGIWVTMLGSAGALPPEAEPIRPEVGLVPETTEIPVQKTEEQLRQEWLTVLLCGRGLTLEQETALRTRMTADELLLQRLERGELTEGDLACLALPNGRADLLERYAAWRALHPEASPADAVLQVNMDQDRPFYSQVQILEEPGSLTALVNKHCALPDDYVPELEALGQGYGSGSLRPEAAQAFRAMADAARAEGIRLYSVSAYRSFQQQKSTYNNYLRQCRQATADTFSARPGSSEHQTGLALDINAASRKARFERTPAFAWLKAHCAEYGFILRYDDGKQEITGYRFEPWHYRYVGVEIAKACMEQGLCYEEYLALLPAEEKGPL